MVEQMILINNLRFTVQDLRKLNKKVKNPFRKYSDQFLPETVDLQGFFEFTVQKNIQKIKAIIIKSLWISL